MNISELSVKRPTLIVVIFIALVFLGLIGLRSMNYELLPKFDAPIFTIVTPYPGAAPSEVENSVSKKIEEAVVSLPNVDVIRSISQQGISLVVVTLNTGTELEPILNEALRKIQTKQSELPPFALDPSITQVSVSDMPILTLGIEADKTAGELYDLLEYYIKPRLTKIQGVGEINVIGATPREIQINVDREKLDNYNISVLQLVQSIKKSNFNYPVGKIENPNGQISLSMSGKFVSVMELSKHVIVQKPDGSVVKIKDVAEIIDALQTPKTIYRINGKQSIGLQITKKQDANTVLVSNEIKKEIEKLEAEYSNIQLKFSIPLDGSILIKDAAKGVARDLIYAIILVTVIMLVFLHSGRNALIVMIAVPLSLISTFIGIKLFDYTLNLMTLLALSIIIGTLVDDAIVVLENVYRHLEMGKNRLKATLDGVKEVGLTVISTSLVLVVVFLPVALSESVISPIIEPFAMVIVIAVIISTFSALTIVPLLTSRFSKLEIKSKIRIWNRIIKIFEGWIEKFSAFIQKILFWSLRRPFWALLITTVLLISSFGLIGGGFIGGEFVSMGDVGEGIITLEYPKNYTLKQNNLATQKIEKYISSKPEVRGIYSSVGKASGILTVQSGYDKTEISVKLVDKNQRDISSAMFFKQLENELNATFSDVKIRTGIVTLMGGADEAPIQIVFRGTEEDTVMTLANKMIKEIRKIHGTNNVKLTIESGLPELQIQFNKEKMARLGINPEIAGASIQTSFSGNKDNKLQQGNFEYDIKIRLDAFNRASMDDVRNITVINNMGQAVKLEQFAEITEITGSSRLERYNRITSVMLESQAIGRPVGDVGNDILQLLDNTKFPEGVEYLPESDLKFQDDAFGTLGLAILIAIVLVYLVMVALYESYMHPFVVLFSIPLSVIGALFALALTQEAISIFSILGMIMLIGLVTKNAILVVDFINRLRKDGMRRTRAIVTGVKLRIRPILMTAISTIVGMLPIALSQAAGSEWKNGLGWTLIGGMTSSMLLSLIIVPLIYVVFEKIKSKILKHKY
ncbi:MAG: efflux RND transporter permease subunit [Saprospiraceae bacterium]|nr:efflux RND transporter permease subunit [Saprospiraceae bacterium]